MNAVMENESTNIYKPLDSNKNKIRILRLRSRQYNRDNMQDEQKIICVLEQRSLDDAGEYTALSYVWGSGSNFNSQVYLSSNEQSVSPNLGDALRQLRNEFNDLFLWADQLCINQHDHAEKASQIRKMRSIYERASQVIAWLGVSANDSDLVLSTFRQIEKHHALSLETSIFSDVARELEQSAPNKPDQMWDATKVLDTLKTALPAFAARPYWTRLWVLQEFVHARHLLIMCGSKTIGSIIFRNAWDILDEATDNLDEEMTAIAEVWRWDTLTCDEWLRVKHLISLRHDYHLYHSHEDHEMGDEMFMIMYGTLTTFSGHIRMSCSDPRDRVFSLLSLASDVHEFRHFPDYTRSIEFTYEEIARNFIQQGHVDTLSFCQENPTHRARNMASWAADWSLKIRIPLWGKLSFDASQNWSADLAASFLDEKTIMISGTCVGTVQSYGCRFPHDRPLTLGQTHMFLDQLRVFCDRSKQVHTTQRELVCAQTAAPFAFAFLRDEELMLTQYRELSKQLEEMTDVPEELELGSYIHFSSDYERELRLQIFNCPLITSNGYVGIGPSYVQEGDCVCIFPGGQTPYILRRQLESNTFSLVGGAYIHGIMNGEYFGKEREVQSFTLV